jgi:flavin reductase (DIM6/NTAB) family NADH-FMN oxidoreductase RutF
MHDIASILGQVPSGVYILTARFEGQETGMLASWVMQAGFEPPMLTVAIQQGRYVAKWLSAKAPFVLNVLAMGQKPLLSHFARGFAPGADAFEGVAIERSPEGLPILCDAVGFLECRPTQHQDSGDHRIFLCCVTAGRLQHPASPMVHIRKNGMHY